MASGFLVKDAKVGIVMENYGAAFVGANLTGVGSIHEASLTYAVISWNTDVTIDTFGQDLETFQCNDDHFDHFIDIRPVGSGSLTCKALDDTVAANLDAYNLWYASTHLPNGCTLADAVVDLAWDATLDTNAGVRASDVRGYAIVVEKKDEKSTPGYYTWTFHNCNISATPGFTPKQATVVNLSWDDARDVVLATGAATFTTHSDA